MRDPDILLWPTDLSDLIQVPERTLARWRVRGEGPHFESYGLDVVFYSLAKVKEWLAGLDRLPIPHNTLRPAGAHRGCR